MTSETIMIRPFDAAADTQTLSEIWFQASLLAHPFIGEARLKEQKRLIEEKYLPLAETWVACRAGEPVGFISLLDTFVGGIFVSPREQGRGIGRRLIAHALSARDGLTLEVYTANEQTCRFYATLGFRELSRRGVDDEGLPFENARLHVTRDTAKV